MKVRYENLDDYRYEIEDNRRNIDIYKDIVDNNSTDIKDNNNDCNTKISYNKINNSNREVKVVRYNSKGAYIISYENDKSVCINIRGII